VHREEVELDLKHEIPRLMAEVVILKVPLLAGRSGRRWDQAH
jgi:hypothetical protein